TIALRRTARPERAQGKILAIAARRREKDSYAARGLPSGECGRNNAGSVVHVVLSELLCSPYAGGVPLRWLRDGVQRRENTRLAGNSDSRRCRFLRAAHSPGVLIFLLESALLFTFLFWLLIFVGAVSPPTPDPGQTAQARADFLAPLIFLAVIIALEKSMAIRIGLRMIRRFLPLRKPEVPAI